MGSVRFLVLLALLAGAWLVPGGPARAQAPPQAAPAPVSVDELQRLVATLKDAGERDKLIAQLQALIDAQRGLAPAPEAEGGGDWLVRLSAQIDAVSAEIVAAAGAVLDIPGLADWIERQASDAQARAQALDIALNLVVVFGVALILEWIVRRLLRRPLARLSAQDGGSRVTQALLLLLVLVVEALPILGFAAIAYLELPLLGAHPAAAHLARIVIQASLAARLILATAKIALLSAGAATLHTLGEETRNYLYIWARRFANLAVYGYSLAAAVWWLGVPGAVYVLVLRGTMLVLGVLAVIFVLQNRAALAEVVRGRPPAADDAGHGQGLRLLRQRLADTWHILAIVYIVGIFGNYVLNIEAGFAVVFRVTLVSLIILIAAGAIVSAVRRLSRRGFAVRQDLKARFPTLEARANRYLPALTVVASAVVYFFAALALLQAWGLDTFGWFSTTFGRKLTGSAVSIATVMLAALVVWELFGSAIERYLSGGDGNGRRFARSARVRTLLPLARTTLLIVLLTVVALVVLSEIGVNIAPLLAGAGVAGIAIGFGSQALVKDLITGLFIVLDDTLAVGEMVDVGKEHIGIVETISVRAIKLRDVSGTLHTVPFSEVSTVRNLTRDYSYFVGDFGVQFHEDPDRVIAVLREVAEELRQDPGWSGSIVEALDVIGVDKFTDSAVVIRARLKCVPLRQWAVGHEFNRRIKKAFDAHGIEMPAVNQTRYLTPPAAPA